MFALITVPLHYMSVMIIHDTYNICSLWCLGIRISTCLRCTIVNVHTTLNGALYGIVSILIVLMAV